MDTFNKNTTTTTSSSNGKMGRRVSFGRKVERRMCTLRRCILRFWERILMCSSVGKPIRYHMLQHHPSSMSSAAPPEPPSSAVECGFELLNVSPAAALVHEGHRDYNIDIDDNVSSKDSDLVSLKISLLGDSQIGKTSFLAKYVGNETAGGGKQAEGLNFMDKTLNVKGARISYSLWELDGDEKFRNQIPVACGDSVAILIMFDLTSRVTLNGVIKWYQEARRWNQTAIPILVGTKFDDFIQLPLDLQWTIASQARAYAKALNATIFFSSATYNINVNKIFKFITAKLFDLSWTVERNLTVGEPIIDF